MSVMHTGQKPDIARVAVGALMVFVVLPIAGAALGATVLVGTALAVPLVAGIAFEPDCANAVVDVTAAANKRQANRRVGNFGITES